MALSSVIIRPRHRVNHGVMSHAALSNNETLVPTCTAVLLYLVPVSRYIPELLLLLLLLLLLFSH